MLRRKGFRRSLTKMMAACVAAFTVLTVFPVSAMAAMHNVSYITIGDGDTVADTMTVNGVTVQALYHPKTDAYSYDNDPKYCCAGLVARFYRSVYGRTVNNLYRIDSIPNIDRGSFSFTGTPKVGDIIRDNVSVHWAIVKEVHGNAITMFQ